MELNVFFHRRTFVHFSCIITILPPVPYVTGVIMCIRSISFPTHVFVYVYV